MSDVQAGDGEILDSDVVVVGGGHMISLTVVGNGMSRVLWLVRGGRDGVK